MGADSGYYGYWYSIVVCIVWVIEVYKHKYMHAHT